MIRGRVISSVDGDVQCAGIAVSFEYEVVAVLEIYRSARKYTFPPGVTLGRVRAREVRLLRLQRRPRRRPFPHPRGRLVPARSSPPAAAASAPLLDLSRVPLDDR